MSSVSINLIMKKRLELSTLTLPMKPQSPQAIGDRIIYYETPEKLQNP
jgi:hypothetical protein